MARSVKSNSKEGASSQGLALRESSDCSNLAHPTPDRMDKLNISQDFPATSRTNSNCMYVSSTVIWQLPLANSLHNSVHLAQIDISMALQVSRICCSNSNSGLRVQALPNAFISGTSVDFRGRIGKQSGQNLTTRREQQGLMIKCGGAADDLGKQVGKVLWGRGLPPGALVDVARQLWGTGWHVMMGQLAPSKKEGEYDRPQSQFRARPRFPGDFHLYVATTCPWAHRALIVHSLKGLGDAVRVSVVVPGTSGLWVFKEEANNSDGNGRYSGTKDKANGKVRLLDAYKGRQGGYEGRATVPMLWDQSKTEVVNNESADIIEILNSDFNDFASNPGLDLAPASLKDDIDRWNGIIYNSVNNGVYRCGFAQGQEAYQAAVDSLFSTLDMLEEHLATSRFLCGGSLTLADIRLFTTLYRFDPVYNTLFKCTKQKLAEYPNLSGYLRDIYQTPGVAETCDLEAIMDGYYRVLFPLNPGSICPAIPRSSQPDALLLPHGRENLSQATSMAMSWP